MLRPPPISTRTDTLFPYRLRDPSRRLFRSLRRAEPEIRRDHGPRHRAAAERVASLRCRTVRLRQHDAGPRGRQTRRTIRRGPAARPEAAPPSPPKRDRTDDPRTEKRREGKKVV